MKKNPLVFDKFPWKLTLEGFFFYAKERVWFETDALLLYILF